MRWWQVIGTVMVLCALHVYGTAARAQTHDTYNAAPTAPTYTTQLYVDVTDRHATRARERALQQAEVEALHQWAGEHMPTHTQRALTQVADSQIRSMIYSLDILEETMTSTRYRAHVRVTYDTHRMEQLLSMLQAQHRQKQQQRAQRTQDSTHSGQRTPAQTHDGRGNTHPRYAPRSTNDSTAYYTEGRHADASDWPGMQHTAGIRDVPYTAAPSILLLAPVAHAGSWPQLRQKLRNVAYVTEAQLVALSPTQMDISLTYSGDADTLLQALAQHQIFVTPTPRYWILTSQ